MDKLRYVFDAVTSIRQALNGRVPLIGFSGSPWTLACYMVEGAGSDDYRLVKTHAVQPARPDAPHAGGQRRRGGRLPQRADRGRRAGRDDLRQLGRRAGRRRLPALQPGLHRAACWRSSSASTTAQRIPRIVFTKGGGLWLEEIAGRRLRRARAWTGRSTSARRAPRVGDRVALQGNLDPNVLFAPPDADRAPRRRAVLDSFGAPHTGAGTGRRTSSTSATASASTRRRSTCSVLVDAVHAHSRAAARGAADAARRHDPRRIWRLPVSERSGLDLCTKSGCGAPSATAATQHRATKPIAR